MGSILSVIRMSGNERKKKENEKGRKGGERRDMQDCTLNTVLTHMKKKRRTEREAKDKKRRAAGCFLLWREDTTQTQR